MTTPDEHIDMCNDCVDRESKLSDWERGFIDSILRQLLEGNTLSPKQEETLDRIWERVT
jgi:hypothetical protein